MVEGRLSRRRRAPGGARWRCCQVADLAVVGEHLADGDQLAFALRLGQRFAVLVGSLQGAQVDRALALEHHQAVPVAGAGRGQHLPGQLGHGFVNSDDFLAGHDHALTSFGL
jgi:hypothetical protein